MKLTTAITRVFLTCALVALTAACAPLPARQAEYSAGRVRLALPPGTWEDLGATDETLRLLPAPDGRVPLQTRIVGLRGAQQELLAVLHVQANQTNHWERSVYWPGYCPQQQGVVVEDATHGSRVRVDCLRFKRRADGAQWLDKHQPQLAQWLAGRALALPAPYSYMSYRYASEGGASVAVEALVDLRLLQPLTRSNTQFLAAGRPALQWGHELAQAARTSVGMMDGHLAIPAFPFTVPASH